MKFKQYLNEFKKETKSYAFDVDDTLVTTDSKVHVFKGDEKVKSLSPQDFNEYKLGKGENFNFDDFSSNDIIVKTGKKTSFWSVAQNINDAIKNGKSNSVLYIITARPTEAKKGLYDFLVNQGLSELKLKNVFTVGDKGTPVSSLKKMVLKNLKKKHTEVTFFDDDTKNIELAKELKTIKARKVKI